ncbi:hypothetical protein BB558_004827 [Smittium angustum]|uniref:Uncharacterized protein n=1 Tax=Smittium angustum TaxID=133377 RepID=A0A2U1J2E1_SMIAN|nr:hypothetical protein BB558_004827 [Smittium angustum]
MPQEGTPQYQIYKLWMDPGIQGKLLKKYSKQINNALALAYQLVSKFQPQTSEWVPNAAIQGKLFYRILGLKPGIDYQPRFAQIYVYNPDHDVEKSRYLHQCNNYITDFKSIIEINPEDISFQRFVINANAVSIGYHPGRYNQSSGFKKISVLIGDSNLSKDIAIHAKVEFKLLMKSQVF